MVFQEINAEAQSPEDGVYLLDKQEHSRKKVLAFYKLYCMINKNERPIMSDQDDRNTGRTPPPSGAGYQRSYQRNPGGAGRYSSAPENRDKPQPQSQAGSPGTEKQCRFRFEKLSVWQDARALNQEIHRLTQSLPTPEFKGLTDMMRQASLSTSAGIAEGATRKSDDEFAQYLEQVHGRLMQLGSHLFVATDLGYLKPAQIEPALDLVERLGARLLAFRRSFSNKTKTPSD
jgi:four helix bundle protein